jgi:hypothetical protein
MGQKRDGAMYHKDILAENFFQVPNLPASAMATTHTCKLGHNFEEFWCKGEVGTANGCEKPSIKYK